MTLYEIEKDIIALGELIESVSTTEDGEPREITPEEWETLHEYMKELNGAFSSKAERICRYIREEEAGADACRAEEERLYKMRKTRERKAQSLKSLLHFFMERQGLTKQDAGAFKLSIQNNPPSVRVLDESLLSPEYMRIVPETVTPDKKLIAEALKAGAEVKGAELLQTKSLRVK